MYGCLKQNKQYTCKDIKLLDFNVRLSPTRRCINLHVGIKSLNSNKCIDNQHNDQYSKVGYLPSGGIKQRQHAASAIYNMAGTRPQLAQVVPIYKNLLEVRFDC